LILGDFDNDGFLDMYLGTGEPSIATRIPNRIFKNKGGERFSEIPADQAIEVTEFAEGFRPLGWKPLPQPE
jgi:hypothetical protein